MLKSLLLRLKGTGPQGWRFIYLFIILVNGGKAACDLLQLEKIVWRGLAAPTPGAAVPGMLSEKLKKKKKQHFCLKMNALQPCSRNCSRATQDRGEEVLVRIAVMKRDEAGAEMWAGCRAVPWLGQPGSAASSAPGAGCLLPPRCARRQGADAGSLVERLRSPLAELHLGSSSK